MANLVVAEFPNKTILQAGCTYIMLDGKNLPTNVYLPVIQKTIGSDGFYVMGNYTGDITIKNLSSKNINVISCDNDNTPGLMNKVLIDRHDTCVIGPDVSLVFRPVSPVLWCVI